jgi:hypothetical protein
LKEAWQLTHPKTITTGPPPGQSGACVAQYNHYILNGSKSAGNNPNHHNPSNHAVYHNPNSNLHAGYQYLNQHQSNHQPIYHNPYQPPTYQPSPNHYHILPYYQQPVHYGAPAWNPPTYTSYY